MTKVLAFIFVLALVQSFPFEAISGDSSTTANTIKDGPNVTVAEIKSGNTGIDAEGFKIIQEDYYGKEGKVCKTVIGTGCYETGACCKGGPACELLYEKIESASSWLSTWTLVNFCSSN